MQFITLVSALSAAGLLPTLLAAPVIERRQINNDDVPGSPVGPPGASGSLYGGEGLLGDAGLNSATPSIAATVATGSLVPGQTASPDLGFYLDFTDAPTPQPIRGDEGNTDPGPRLFPCQLT